ncbi:phage-related protein tail component-like protein [uncultured Mediterranean phage uvMED]|nr:phage-related protein tail component-like protein [uncultured Mediterranean phage uvMED]
MTQTKYVAGSGGGGGGGKGGGGGSHTPTEADDTLQSVQFASVLDVISEGEIQGLEDGNKSIFLEDTPIENADGSNNFQSFEVVTRTGTQTQTHISGDFGSTQSEQAVNAEVSNSTPVTRSITDTDVDRVRVTLTVPSLRIVEDDGDITGHSVSIKIQIQYNGGGFNDVVSDTIAGKSSAKYQRDYMIALSGAFPVDIRMVRVSADETSTRRASSTFFQAYTEIIDEKFRYPNSALVGLRFDSRQFGSVPNRKYLIRGIKIKIPSNATVDTTTHLGRITYSGVWDGTFQAATWTNDPAWCLYDLLINDRYGAGIPEDTLDRYDFFSISQYCNALVNDGEGGQEPRFSLNMLINSRDEVYNVIQQLTGIFRGIAYYGSGSLVLLQDKPTDSQYLLGPSNVAGGTFSYSGSSQKSRHTVAVVAWQSYDTRGGIEYEYVEDHAAVAKYGIIKKDIKSIGCYSQGQAHRLGKWTLLSEQNLTETCEFAVAIDSGIIVRPGMVVDVADPLRGGTRRSGRVSSATTTVITIDSTTDLSVNLANSPTISVMMPTGLAETRSISSISNAEITVTAAFSEAPNAAAVYMIETTDIQVQKFRVLSVAESGDGVYGVSAIAYNESIYAAIEENISLTTRDITNLSATPSAPENLTGSEFLYQEGQTVHTGFDFSWSHDRRNTNDFLVKYKLDNDNFTTLVTGNPSITLRALRAGTLSVQVLARNYLGKQSTISTATFTLVGKTAVPGDVQNLSIEPISANSARLRWDQTVDLDVKVNGLVHIKHSSLTDGSATWPNSVDLIPAVGGNSTEAIVPLVAGEIFAKFEDDLGNKSTNATSVLMQFPDTLGRLIVQTRREDQDSPPFQGTKTDCFYSEGFDALIIDGDEAIDAVTDFDAITSFDFLGDILSSAEYQFVNTLDLGARFSLDLQRRFVTRAFFPNDTVDARTALVDTWNDFDGTDADAVNAKLYFRSTVDDPTGTPTYSAWQEFISGTFEARAFQFKAELNSSDIAQNILVDELGYEATFQRRQENSNGTTASGTSTKSVAFDKAFFVGTASLGGANAYLPSVAVTIQNLGNGERLNVSNVSATGFDLDILDGSNNNVNRNFTYAAVGYGKAV